MYLGMLKHTLANSHALRNLLSLFSPFLNHLDSLPGAWTFIGGVSKLNI